MCFDVNCSCVDAKKDTCTSMSTSTDKNATLTTGDTSLKCMIFNRRINEAKKDVKDNNGSLSNEALTKTKGMPGSFMIGQIFKGWLNVNMCLKKV